MTIIKIGDFSKIINENGSAPGIRVFSILIKYTILNWVINDICRIVSCILEYSPRVPTARPLFLRGNASHAADQREAAYHRPAANPSYLTGRQAGSPRRHSRFPRRGPRRTFAFGRARRNKSEKSGERQRSLISTDTTIKGTRANTTEPEFLPSAAPNIIIGGRQIPVPLRSKEPATSPPAGRQI